MSQVVKEGTKEELARWLWDVKQRGDVVEVPSRVDQLAGGRLRIVVRLHPRTAQARGSSAGTNRAGGSYRGAVSPAARRLDRRVAITIAAAACSMLIAGGCYAAGVTGWGIGVLKNLGIAVLVLVVAVVLIAAAINEVRDTRRR